jgi:hypothetical protein
VNGKLDFQKIKYQHGVKYQPGIKVTSPASSSGAGFNRNSFAFGDRGPGLKGSNVIVDNGEALLETSFKYIKPITVSHAQQQHQQILPHQQQHPHHHQEGVKFTNFFNKRPEPSLTDRKTIDVFSYIKNQ